MENGKIFDYGKMDKFLNQFFVVKQKQAIIDTKTADMYVFQKTRVFGGDVWGIIRGCYRICINLF